MARRNYPLRKNCAHDGCREVARWSYETQRDLVSSFEFRNEYRCIRHSRPMEVLATDNDATEKVLVSKRGAGGNMYWDNSGFVHGPGFKAFADDFPEGTQLVVTARIVTPNRG